MLVKQWDSCVVADETDCLTDGSEVEVESRLSILRKLLHDSRILTRLIHYRITRVLKH